MRTLCLLFLLVFAGAAAVLAFENQQDVALQVFGRLLRDECSTADRGNLPRRNAERLDRGGPLAAFAESRHPRASSGRISRATMNVFQPWVQTWQNSGRS